MKKIIISALFFSFIINCFVMAQTRPMAKSGETVWIFLNPVKKDKRQQFEKFLHVIFWPGAKKLSAADQQVFKQTRILHPTKPEPDGTYSYFFVMDPAIKEGDYDILSLLTKMYGAAKAKEHYKLFEDSLLNGKQKGYIETQSKD
ncbi:MAG: hypothetical protein U0X91_09015 [Spirosomataceae bacterium]